ncbi:MAG: D-Ala-D-Ala carboxypeptidase family metallohydrolase [Pseudomonadota bacterium]|nr:D-Ala-D-Ala carboxypeptidase family metallohydrolase [Pseudomonadota bacterium]
MQRLSRSIALLALSLLVAPVAAQTVAEGQARADYLAWLAREPAARAQVLGFKTFLAMKEVQDVVPTWQLVRTASMWRDCAGPRFEVAPVAEWQHISDTLTFVKSHVEPVIGEVEALSGYRNEGLNQCSGGAKASAHRHFYALDLTPVKALTRAAMQRSLCAIHSFRGPDYDVGLGFYSGMRFHVDSKGYRRWGSDGKGATSPCATGQFS